MPFKSLYSASKRANALLFVAILDIEESDKEDIRVIGINNGSIKLDTQTKLEKYLIFLANNLFLDNGIDKKTD